jgi:anti-sigma regulatory factor (Ser/Thr protein kinase)
MNAKQDRNVTSDSSHAPMWKCFRLTTREEISAFLDALLDELNKAPANACDIFAVRLAMEEAVTNALEHGYSGRCEEVRARVLLRR